MNYYQFHIGDFVTATVHLSPMEELAYRRLLDMYYSSEAPIPLATEWVCRRLRMDTEVVDLVLREFFIRTENGWSNSRCEAEINAYRRKADIAKANGKLGGRPKITQPVNLANPPETGSKANQEPVTSNQEPITSKEKISTLRVEPETVVSSNRSPPVPFQEIVNLYHTVLPELPRVAKLTKQRMGLIRQRWAEDIETLDKWRDYFTFVRDSDFLMGKAEPSAGRPPFRADLEWLCRPANITKVIEMKFHR